MNSRSIFSGILLVVLSATLTSCGSSTRVTNTKETSVGQQLTDLDSARKQGIINDSEYNRLKKAIIADND